MKDEFNHKIFAKWWLSFCLISFLFGWMLYNGAIEQLLIYDQSGICWVILGLFFITMLSLGRMYYKAASGDWHDVNLKIEWWAADSLMGLGIIGTVIGFMSMLLLLGDIDINNIQMIIKNMSSSLGIALINTLIGLVSSIIIKFQLTILEKEMD